MQELPTIVFTPSCLNLIVEVPEDIKVIESRGMDDGSFKRYPSKTIQEVVKFLSILSVNFLSTQIIHELVFLLSECRVCQFDAILDIIA